MARVRVRIEDFEDGVYPDVCASSGVEGGARLYRAAISSRSPWLWLLVLGGPAGIIAALVLHAVLQKTAHGYLPYAEAVQVRLYQRSRRFAWGAVASLGVVVGSLLLTTSGTSGFRGLGAFGFVAGIVGMLAFGFLWSNVPGSVGGRLDTTGRWIELDPVNARFAAAYEQQEARRRTARRADAAGDHSRW